MRSHVFYVELFSFLSYKPVNKLQSDSEKFPILTHYNTTCNTILGRHKHDKDYFVMQLII